ncbi:MAG TPA: hypothetical protein VFX02_02430 [Gammaproteobacteria bacterium]|nr:hypothetical protein [Gammaproteobacteria bacterium]
MKRTMAGARIALCGLCTLPSMALAQPEYDGYAIPDRFSLGLGVYEQTDHRTQINLEDTELGIGANIDLEDDLNVEEDTGRVFRLDGYYRFSRAHRIEWTWYSTQRSGRAEILETVDIGGVVEVRFGARVESLIEYGVFKLGYAWSFINTESWEANLGIGANFYRDRVQVTARTFSGLDTEVRRFEEEGDGPLPAASFGLRYMPGRWALYWDYDVVSTELGEFSGRLRESTIGVEHNTWEHAGFGLGVINSADFVETEDNGTEGEFDSEYRGWRLYLKTWF